MDISVGSFPNTGIYITRGKAVIVRQASSSGTPSKVIWAVSLGTAIGSCDQAFTGISKSNPGKRLLIKTAIILMILLIAQQAPGDFSRTVVTREVMKSKIRLL